MNTWVLITGASRGLGKELAHAFWKAGYQLLLVSRQPPSCEEFQKPQLDASDQKIKSFSCDLACAEDLEQLLRKLEPFGAEIDVLINNAAIQGPIGEFVNNDAVQWKQTLEVNLMSPSKISQWVGKHMKAKKQGTIINLSGGGATGPRPNFSAYATAKAGLVRFSETLAEELKTYNVSVNCIAPGAMPTEMLRQVLLAGPVDSGDAEYEKARELFAEGQGSTQQVTDLALFLASDQGRRITGKLISALWDNWEEWPNHMEELQQSDVYSLRRITGRDRGMQWGDK